MSDHALTILSVWLGLAMGLAGMAIGVSGFRHPILIWGLFGGSGVSFFYALKQVTPVQAVGLFQEVAGNRWVEMLVVAAVVYTVTAELNRRRKPKEPPPTPGAITFVGTEPPPQLNDTPDVRDAKLALGNYVVKQLIPIELKLRPVIAHTAHYVRDLNPQSPQANLAWNAVVASQPQFGNLLKSFETADKIKSIPMPKLELEIIDALMQYYKGVEAIAKVIEDSTKQQGTWTGTSFAKAFRLWFPEHRKFVEQSNSVFSDVHFNALRGHATASVDQRLDYFDKTA